MEYKEIILSHKSKWWIKMEEYDEYFEDEKPKEVVKQKQKLVCEWCNSDNVVYETICSMVMRRCLDCRCIF